MKEKLELFEEIPLLSARDVKEMVVRELYEQMIAFTSLLYYNREF